MSTNLAGATHSALILRVIRALKPSVNRALIKIGAAPSLSALSLQGRVRITNPDVVLSIQNNIQPNFCPIMVL